MHAAGKRDKVQINLDFWAAKMAINETVQLGYAQNRVTNKCGWNLFECEKDHFRPLVRKPVSEQYLQKWINHGRIIRLSWLCGNLSHDEFESLCDEWADTVEAIDQVASLRQGDDSQHEIKLLFQELNNELRLQYLAWSTLEALKNSASLGSDDFSIRLKLYYRRHHPEIEALTAKRESEYRLEP